MATKLTANVAKRVKALGINATTDEAARPELLKILEDNGIEQMDDEDITTLVEIAESFVDTDDSEGDSNEEDENDALAEEVEEEEEKAPKKSAKGKKKEEEPEDEDEEDDDDDSDEDEEGDEEGDEFDDMDRNELKAYIKENGLEISVKKSWSDEDIREKIREAISSNEEEDDDEEEEEVPAPKKAPAKKEEKKAPAKKEEKKATTTPKRGNKLDPKNNEEDRKHFDFLKKLFPEDKYIYAWVASAGVTIKFKGKNSNRSLISLENCTINGEGKKAVMTCNLYLLIFNNKYEALDKAEIEYEKCWNGAPMLKGIEVSEALEIIENLKEEMDKMVGGIDKKLGDNRKKMEDNLKKDKKATGKVSAKQVEEEDDDEEEEEEKPKKSSVKAGKKATAKKVEDDEEEDDEEEEEAPKKKATSKNAAKKTVKKK